MAVFPAHIVLDILKETDNSDFKDVKAASADLSALLDQIIAARPQIYNAVASSLGYFYFYNDTTRGEDPELTEHLDSLSAEQKRHLGELKVTSPDSYDQNECPVYSINTLLEDDEKPQFKKLLVEDFAGSLQHLPSAFGTNFESVVIVNASVEKNDAFQLLSAVALKHLCITKARLPVCFQKELLGFLKRMTWETVELEEIFWSRMPAADSDYMNTVELLVKTWQRAAEPAAERFKSEFRQPGGWTKTMEKFAEIGERRHDGTIVVTHEKKKREAHIATESNDEEERIVIEFVKLK